MVNDATKLKEELNNWKNRNGKYLSKNEKEEYLRHWQYRKLYPIQKYLDSNWNKRYNKLDQEFKELEYPDFHSFMRQTMMGPISPKKIEDLVVKVFQKHPKPVEDAKKNPKTKKFLVGKVMEFSNHTADPKILNEIVDKKLKELKD